MSNHLQKFVFFFLFFKIPFYHNLSLSMKLLPQKIALRPLFLGYVLHPIPNGSPFHFYLTNREIEIESERERTRNSSITLVKYLGLSLPHFLSISISLLGNALFIFKVNLYLTLSLSLSLSLSLYTLF